MLQNFNTCLYIFFLIFIYLNEWLKHIYFLKKHFMFNLIVFGQKARIDDHIKNFTISPPNPTKQTQESLSCVLDHIKIKYKYPYGVTMVPTATLHSYHVFFFFFILLSCILILVKLLDLYHIQSPCMTPCHFLSRMNDIFRRKKNTTLTTSIRCCGWRATFQGENSCSIHRVHIVGKVQPFRL